MREGESFLSFSGQRQGIVGSSVGQGGQGTVYLAKFGNEEYALKWYHDAYRKIDTSLMDRLKRAISMGAPDSRFLWPLELVHRRDVEGFGYIMDIRPQDYCCIRDILAPKPQRIELSLSQRIFVCRQIADSFLNLHASGFCYQDINFGNFFIHPRTAEIMICDNDNVNVNGADASIYGTKKFMAPEIVRRECLPNTHTDLFSIAVLFFYILFGWHPLDGRREAEARILTEEVDLDLYGTNPLFIFDKNNDNNGPLSPMHDAIQFRWKSLPPNLSSLFVRAFGLGLSSPDARILEKEWLKNFDKISGGAFGCSHCRYEHFAFPSSEGTMPSHCLNCGEGLDAPATIIIGDKCLALQTDGVLSLQDIGQINADRWAGAAIVVAHPKHEGVLGLRNIMDSKWIVHPPDRETSSVTPGKTVTISDGMRINFGTHQGVIHLPNPPTPANSNSGEVSHDQT